MQHINSTKKKRMNASRRAHFVISPTVIVFAKCPSSKFRRSRRRRHMRGGVGTSQKPSSIFLEWLKRRRCSTSLEDVCIRASISPAYMISEKEKKPNRVRDMKGRRVCEHRILCLVYNTINHDLEQAMSPLS